MRLFRAVICVFSTMVVSMLLSKRDFSLQHKQRLQRGGLAPCWEVLSVIIEYLNKFKKTHMPNDKTVLVSR